jgi:hypothetical protein
MAVVMTLKMERSTNLRHGVTTTRNRHPYMRVTSPSAMSMVVGVAKCLEHDASSLAKHPDVAKRVYSFIGNGHLSRIVTMLVAAAKQTGHHAQQIATGIGISAAIISSH